MKAPGERLKESVGQEIPARRQPNHLGRVKSFSQNLLQALGVWFDYKNWAAKHSVAVDKKIERDAIIVAFAVPSETIADECNEIGRKARHRPEPVFKIRIAIALGLQHQQAVWRNGKSIFETRCANEIKDFRRAKPWIY